ncbi:MAG: beta-lactamase family protein [Treponema sp.]|jgi:CubicO group peptidase (beta-lactamase class C family)|nr:beta-lactamase family protein [Treponema sp.]
METTIEGSGFCPKRLQYVDDYLRRIVDTGQAAGVGASLFRHGVRAYRKSFGMRDIAKKLPMENDSIYRIYSMSKTITIAAAMTLYERGLFKLHDPISEFLTGFENPTVASHDPRGILSIVPAKTPLTFHHLFTMTSGIPYPGPDSLTARVFAEIQSSMKVNGKSLTTAQAVELMAHVPLCFHPGEYWMYGFSHDVLGRLIEVISGKSLGRYLQETIFEPLGMEDTAFFVPPNKRARLSRAYAWSEMGLREIPDDELSSDPGSASAPPDSESGGGGLASTLEDVERYGRMLLGSGKFEGKRVLSRKTIDLIRQNHVLPAHIQRFGFPSMAGYGYGLGVRTMLDTGAAGLGGSVGEWAWDGMLGTWYAVDPQEDMTAVFLIQRNPGANEDLPKRFAQTVYAAIDD